MWITQESSFIYLYLRACLQSPHCRSDSDACTRLRKIGSACLGSSQLDYGEWFLDVVGPWCCIWAVCSSWFCWKDGSLFTTRPSCVRMKKSPTGVVRKELFFDASGVRWRQTNGRCGPSLRVGLGLANNQIRKGRCALWKEFLRQIPSTRSITWMFSMLSHSSGPDESKTVNLVLPL